MITSTLPRSQRRFLQMSGTAPILASLRVASLDAQEQCSDLFRIHAELVLLEGTTLAELETATSTLPGTEIAIGIGSGSGEIQWRHGIVDRCTMDLAHGTLAVDLVPALAKLDGASGCATYVDKTTPQVVEQLFADHKIDDVDTDLKGNYSKRPFVRQYHETSLNFLRRLLEDEGIFFYFRHTQKGHTLVLRDSSAGYQDDVSATTPVELRPDVDGKLMENVITGLAREHTRPPGTFTVRSYDPAKPRASLQAVATPMQDAKAQHGLAEQQGIVDREQVRRTATIRMEEQEVYRNVYSGTSTVRDLAPGRMLAIQTEHDVIRLVVTRLDTTAIDAVAGAPISFRNTFLAIPVDVTIRPERVTPKPVASGVELAIVAADQGRTEPKEHNEIHTNELREIRVRFLSDTPTDGKTNSSGWIRVASPFAGRGFGIDAIPRVGSEVAVAYIDGDPHRPVVVNGLFNEAASQPRALGEQAKGVALKTCIKNNGKGPVRGHMLAFDDDEKAPGVRMLVDGKYVAAVAGDQEHSVSGTHSEHVGGAFSLVADDAFVEKIKGKRITSSDAGLYMDSKAEIVLQASKKLSLVVGSNHLTISDSGIAINGKPFLKLNSGGDSPGTMESQEPKRPTGADAMLEE